MSKSHFHLVFSSRHYQEVIFYPGGHGTLGIESTYLRISRSGFDSRKDRRVFVLNIDAVVYK
jgi:hypothetical protein